MSDTRVALTLGTVVWLLGGAGFVAALVSGMTLFAQFAVVFILLGIGIFTTGITWALRSR